MLDGVGQNVNFNADAELTGSEGIDIDGGSGTFTFTDTDITPSSAGGPGLDISGGTSSVNFLAAGSITQTQNEDAVEITLRGPKEHILLVLMIIPLVAVAIDRLLYWVQRQLFPYRYGGPGILNRGVRATLHGWDDLKSLFFKRAHIRPPGENR